METNGNGCSLDVIISNPFIFTVLSENVFFKQASRGPLHKASISGQYQTVKMLLQNGEDVDQRDQVLVFSCLYNFSVKPVLSATSGPETTKACLNSIWLVGSLKQRCFHITGALALPKRAQRSTMCKKIWLSYVSEKFWL